MTWSTKYKKSIDCNNPKGFSQKAHCQARKLRQMGKKTESKPISEMAKPKLTALDKFRAAAAQREKEAEQRRKEMESRHAQGKEDMKGAIDRLAASLKKEDVPVNNVSQGNIAGVGVGPQGEPGVKKKKVASFISFMTRKGKK